MNKSSALPSSRDWPADGLEPVHACPLCASAQRKLAYREVRDWTFESAGGSWTYWSCERCSSLYLDPRPTVGTIGQAYQAYYTHGTSSLGGLRRLKQRLINECWSHALATDIQPRLGLPRALGPLLGMLRDRFPPPFELEALSARPRGHLMDVGCGDGGTLALAAGMGFTTVGLEFDANAARAAQARGLQVSEGGYLALDAHRDSYDYLICSHLVEHVHQPLLLLQLIRDALKKDGTAFISCPNADSHLRHRFGSSWRGLEAPRHLTIPSLTRLKQLLEELGFAVRQVDPAGPTTTQQSARIARKRGLDPEAPLPDATPSPSGISRSSQPDLIQLVCTKLG